MKNVVVDTNVLVSAVILPRSVPRKAVEWVFQHARFALSSVTVAVADEVLRRPRLDKYVREEDA